MAEEEEEIEETIEEVQLTSCGFCSETGLILSGWDEDGNELFEPCSECGGDGLK